MNTFTRQNAWNNGGTFKNPDLLWYAKGVGAMMQRALNDRNSWWFFAAIHGQYLPGTPNAQSAFPGWQAIPPSPRVPIVPLPSTADMAQFWDQCQHQSWYFPPWHRGYLLALEAQIRQAVVSLGGPASWALPYWNYFGPATQYKIPPAFTQKMLPDGVTPNPLYVTARYGPRSDGDIFIPIPPVSQGCISNTIYTGSNAQTPRPGFGGPQTGFSHNGRVSGNLESNPHNQVHVDVGGSAPSGSPWGLMSDPGIAALDPIFYIHHSNIDRMWSHWNGSGMPNPMLSTWLNGPVASGARAFVVPMPGGVPWVYKPADVNSLSQLNYTYDDLVAGAPPHAAVGVLAARLRKLGVVGAPSPASDSQVSSTQGAGMDTAKDSELVGAHDGALQIMSSGARAQVRLDAASSRALSASLKSASLAAPPDRAYLALENVRGTRDAQSLTVYVNGHSAGTVALFGLSRATAKDADHGGSGLTFELDITSIIDTLHVEGALQVEALDVKILPSHPVQTDAPLSIGRVSIIRESHR